MVQAELFSLLSPFIVDSQNFKCILDNPLVIGLGHVLVIAFTTGQIGFRNNQRISFLFLLTGDKDDGYDCHH